MRDKIEFVKKLLKELHRGASVDDLKSRYGDLLKTISPFEIPLIEQQLVREGISVKDILKLCDLHVALFREALEKRELKDVPKGHPVELLMRENDVILKWSEILGLYAAQLVNSKNVDEARKFLENTLKITSELRKVRIHYRKVQMLIFPYLERRGINAVPRVLWGREDQVIVKLRNFYEKAMEALNRNDLEGMREAGQLALEISKEVSELVFRENKILYPAVYALFSDEEWSVIARESDRIGWIVDTSDREWKPVEKQLYPYMVEAAVTPEQFEKLPDELKKVLTQIKPEPDTYRIVRDDDIEFETGFLNKDEIEGLFKALPVEITFANKDHRVRFFSESMFHKGFVRTKTIIGRRLEYCHPPRLEALVNKIADEILSGKSPYREFWTKLGDRIIRVLIVPVKKRDGEIIGVAELVEDMTDIVNNPEKIKEKIMVL